MQRRLNSVGEFILSISLDAALVFLSFTFVYWLRFISGFIKVTKGVYPFSHFLPSILYITALWILIFYFQGHYETRKSWRLLDEIYEIIKGGIVASLIALAPTFFARPFEYSRLYMGLSLLIAIFFVIFGRIVIKKIKMPFMKRGKLLYRTAIVGKEEMGMSIANVLSNPIYGYKIVGHITIGNESKISDDIPTLGSVDKIADIVKKHDIDTLIMSFPIRFFKNISQILFTCKDLNVRFLFTPDIYELVTYKVTPYEINGLLLFGIKEYPLEGWYGGVKRLMDIIAASIGLILASPLLLIVAVLIKLTSKGPIFYVQERIGLNKKPFTMMKFRTMIHNAEVHTGPVWAKKNDKRVTPIGRILRRTRIDEIPQLINVLQGNMSIIGPRPERSHFVRKLSRIVPNYSERFRIRPGITGLAQVEHVYDRTTEDVEQKLKHDLYYLENVCFQLDFEIAIRTIRVILTGRGAH
jgi:exopolysaccharide biosynthesis polyprenyl glycosylphosphotransferase